MITLRKLASLAEGTRRRKIPVLIRDFEQMILRGLWSQRDFLMGLMDLVIQDDFWSENVRYQANTIHAEVLSVSSQGSQGQESLPWMLNSLRHGMLLNLGKNWADWDAETPGDSLEASTPLPMRVFLDGVRSPFNVGSIMRTSWAYNVQKLWVTPDGAQPSHPRCQRSAMGAAEVLAWDVSALRDLDARETGTVFALELGGTPAGDFCFPKEGTVLLGSEELGLSPAALERARGDGGVVSIPLPGPKASLNVGVAFGILMNHWMQSCASED